MQPGETQHPASCQDKEASPGFDLPSVASILRVGCNKTPFSQNLKDLVPCSPETTPCSCACAGFFLFFLFFASSSVTGPAPCALCSLPLCEELQEEGFVSRAEENDGMA